MHLKLVVREKQDSLSLNENAHKNVKKGPKIVKKPLFVKICKPIAPFERSSPKIYVVDSEALIHEISNYAVKSKRFFFLGWKYAQNTKKGPKNRH